MGIHFGIWLVFLALAGLVGFCADRASICTVKAVEEILTTRRAYMLLSFAKTVLWVIGISIWLVWWLGAAAPATRGFAIAWSAVFGGVLFGVGAVFNGGCAIATLTRLGNGNLGMIVSLAGFVAGVAVFEFLNLAAANIGPIRAAPWIELTDRSAMVAGVVLSLWMLWEIVRLWRTAPTERPWKLFSSLRFRLSTAAAVIGASNGILYAFLGTWSYTHTLGRSIGQAVAPAELAPDEASAAMLWSLFAALVVGVLISAALKRRFVLAWRPRAGWHGYFWGGILMGFGAALVPGGNDVLLLNAIPGLSPGALPAYLAMLVGIAIALMVMKWSGAQWIRIDCSGDVCQEGES